MAVILSLSGGAVAGIVIAVLVVLAAIIIASCARVVRQSTAVIVERLGKYHRTLNTGFHLIAPFIDRTSKPISLKEIVADFKPQPVITKDNVTMQIDTVVYFSVTDPKLYTYGVDRPVNAIENLTATTLRNIVGELELDETLTSRDTVNSKMRIILDEATDPWGIKINRVELKNILPPKDIQEAMEKQMRAERERREAILKAEGEKKSSILRAEGEKESKILRAEADKEARVLAADAEKQARIMQAEAEKAALIAEGEGRARAITLINEATPSAAYVTLEGFDALKQLSNGQSTKIVVPSDLANVTGLLASLKETVADEKPKAEAKPEAKKAAK
ncbi:MAG: SPFH/Band 7/PHB domain protein [Clostridia bacterium]|nr:SPFH/Band 7/PHB domain protein [Clostridia bacterium]